MAPDVDQKWRLASPMHIERLRADFSMDVRLVEGLESVVQGKFVE